MRLEGLYPNFGKCSSTQQLQMISAYRLKRIQDLANIQDNFRKLEAVEVNQILCLTEEEKGIIKLLGLKQKDVLALRDCIQVPEYRKDDISLLQSNDYEEED